MSTWVILALFLLGFSILGAISIKEPIVAILTGMFFLFIEGLIYGMARFIPWVLGWNAEMVIKISFIAMPSLILLGILVFIYSEISERNTLAPLGGVLIILGVIVGIVSLILISNIAWLIAALLFAPMVIWYGIIMITGNKADASKKTVLTDKQHPR